MPYKNILYTSAYIVLGILLAFGSNIGMGLVLATDLPIVAVESGSMEPTFYRGDILILTGVNAKELKIGDIIVFTPAGHTIPKVHRIIKINPDGTFQTKGDANPTQLGFEKRILPSQIHGKQIIIIPYLGWIKIIFTEVISPNIIPMGAGIIVAFVAYTGLYSSRKKKKQKLKTKK